MNEPQQIKETYTIQKESIVTSNWNPSSEQNRLSLTHNNDSPLTTNNNRTYISQIIINPKPIKFIDKKESYCSKCGEIINDNQIEFHNRFYHLNCFKCSICQRNLDHLKNNRFQLSDQGEAICSNCELLNAEICLICQKKILDENLLIFNQNNYHSNCFTCSICRTSLIDQTNIRINNSQLICFQCYHRDLAPQCQQCSQPISIGKKITFNKNEYHFDCFRCYQCNEIINEKNVSIVNSKHYCSQCYRKDFAVRCNKCFTMIENEKLTIFNEKKYHLNCFRCHYCDKTILEREFRTNNDKVYCIQCFEKYIASKCVQCLQIISTGKSINYHNNQYHTECFRCIQCNQIMTENQFHTQNSKPCCNQCYNEHFTLKCYKCSKLILDRYTKFQDKTFHVQCFNCYKCHRIIDSRDKFYDGELGVLCSTCAN